MAERVGLNQTAVNFWSELETQSKQIKLLIARSKAKLGQSDEALELIAEFEDDSDENVVKTIGYVLSKSGLHDVALGHYQKHLDEQNLEIMCMAGISALRSGDLDTATACLISSAESSRLETRLKSVRSLGNFLTYFHITEWSQGVHLFLSVDSNLFNRRGGQFLASKTVDVVA